MLSSRTRPDGAAGGGIIVVDTTPVPVPVPDVDVDVVVVVEVRFSNEAGRVFEKEEKLRTGPLEWNASVAEDRSAALEGSVRVEVLVRRRRRRSTISGFGAVRRAAKDGLVFDLSATSSDGAVGFCWCWWWCDAPASCSESSSSERNMNASSCACGSSIKKDTDSLTSAKEVGLRKASFFVLRKAAGSLFADIFESWLSSFLRLRALPDTGASGC